MLLLDQLVMLGEFGELVTELTILPLQQELCAAKLCDALFVSVLSELRVLR